MRKRDAMVFMGWSRNARRKQDKFEYFSISSLAKKSLSGIVSRMNRRVVTVIVLLLLLPLLWWVAGVLLSQYETLRPHVVKKEWFKGNTHTHTLWSDGNDFPEMAAQWYRDRDYQFLVLTDHNVLSRGERWMKVTDINKRRKTLGHPALEKYTMKFGEEWVETRGEGDAMEVRLKTLEETREKLEAPGEFLMIEGEEITDFFQADKNSKRHEVHTNAINVGEKIDPRHGSSLRDTMRNNLIAVQEQAERLGRPIMAHLNHPNFGWAITAEDIAHVIEEEFFEVYNGHPSINHLGNDKVPGDEKIWDIANTIRIGTLNEKPLLALATDDSHHYHGGDASPGRGWVEVRAEKLEAASLIEAMRAGDFYASSGVSLREVKFDAKKQVLELEVDPVEGETYQTEIIGTRSGKTDPDSIGEVLATVSGTRVTYALSGDELYVRATVTSSAEHPNASFKGQKKQAWTQPVGWASKE